MKKGIIITPADLKGCDWAAKIKDLNLNTLGIHSGGGPNHDTLKALGETASDEFRAHAAQLGIDLEYECHISGSALTDQLFKTHPEYFQYSFLTGQRIPDGGWCISNDGLKEILGSTAQTLTSHLPSSTHRYYYWSTDQILSWCHCQECCKYSMAEQNLLSMNHILEAIRQVDPQAELACLAYHNTIQPPKNVQPADGIFLEFAPYPRCFQHSINDPECDHNRKFWNALQEQLHFFDPQKAQILDYWLDVSYFSSYREPKIAPPLKRDILRRDLEAYLSCGITNFTTFAVYMDGEYLKNEGEEALQLYSETLNEFLGK